MLGSSFVIAGVALIVIFAPNQSCPLTAGRFSYLLAQPGAILLLIFIGLVLVALCAHVVPRYAERHVLIPISCASLLGSLTVLASKAVSTFAVQVRATPCALPCALPCCRAPCHRLSTAAVCTPCVQTLEPTNSNPKTNPALTLTVCTDPRGHRDQHARRPG